MSAQICKRFLVLVILPVVSLLVSAAEEYYL